MRVAIVALAILALAAAPTPTVIEESQLAFPMVIHADVPLYPPAARIGNLEGVVKVKVTTDGHRVVNTEVERNEGSILARAAQDNIRSWEFTFHEPAIFTTTFRYVIVDNIDARQNNPTVILKLPTEVEVQLRRWPHCELPKVISK